MSERYGFGQFEGRLFLVTDLFCLGLCLFELAAGQHPFASHFAQEALEGIRNRPAPPLERWRGDLPPAMIELILSLLSKDPQARPTAVQAYERFRTLIR